MSNTIRISEEEKARLQDISKKTGIPLKRLIEMGAKHVINEYKEGRFGVLSESKGE